MVSPRTAKVAVEPMLEALENAPTVVLSDEETAALESVDAKGPWSAYDDVLDKIRSTNE